MFSYALTRVRVFRTVLILEGPIAAEFLRARYYVQVIEESPEEVVEETA